MVKKIIKIDNIKNDINLFLMKPTITTYNFFNLKIIILKILLFKDENI